jgi:hypothetical protein
MSTAANPRHWTEAAVYERLRHVFPGPAYVRLPQVRNGTGYARARTRTADAMIASVWPSRGLWLAGVEIKVSRSDWKKELARAEKSCEIQRYCKRWYVAAPVGVVPMEELPDTWGLIEMRENTAAIAKAAPDLEAVPPDILLICSILRSAAECSVPASVVKEQVSQGIETARATWHRQASYERNELKLAVAEFEKASGLKIDDRYYINRDLGKAVKFVRETGVMSAIDTARRLRDEAERIVKQFDEVLNEFGLHPEGSDAKEVIDS